MLVHSWAGRHPVPASKQLTVSAIATIAVRPRLLHAMAASPSLGRRDGTTEPLADEGILRGRPLRDMFNQFNGGAGMGGGNRSIPPGHTDLSRHPLLVR